MQTVQTTKTEALEWEGLGPLEKQHEAERNGVGRVGVEGGQSMLT